MLPDAITVPGLGWELQPYGLLLAIALLVGWSVIRALGTEDKLPLAPLGTAYVLGAGVGIIGARIAWILQQPGAAGADAALFDLHGDQLAPFAGITLAAVVGGLHLMRRRVPIVAGYDVAILAFAAGAMLERIGALLAGTGYGTVAPELPWSITFPAGSPAFAEHLRTFSALMPAGAERSLPVHPTQIYGVLLAGGALGVGMWLRRRRTYSGQVLLGTAITYLVGRAFVEEWFRADAAAAMLGPFNGAQVSTAVVVAALAVVMRSRAVLAERKPGKYRPWEGGPWSPRAPRAETRAPEPAEPDSAATGGSTTGTKAAGGKARPTKGKGGKPKRRKKR